jgi:predicted AAA+ superfamily ATPase
MIVEDQPAWRPHLRSRYTLRTGETRHLVDPSLAVAALRSSPPRLLQDLNTFGFMFESLAVRDLRVYAQANDAEVLHYRDSEDVECDAIVEGHDGRWAAFEVKLGGGLIDEGAAALNRFLARIDTETCGDPVAKAVVVPSGYAYTRQDGIAVIPIGLLGPLELGSVRV